MKRIISIASLLITFAWSMSTCKKTPEGLSRSESYNLIQSAKIYFSSQLQDRPPAHAANARSGAIKYPFWEAAFTITTPQGSSVVVPIFYQKDLVVTTDFNPTHTIALNSATVLILTKEGPTFKNQMFTFLPDSNDKRPTGGGFSGLIIAERWDGSPINRYKEVQGTIVTELPGREVAKANDGTKETDGIIGQCNTIYGYNYSTDNPEDDLFVDIFIVAPFFRKSG